MMKQLQRISMLCMLMIVASFSHAQNEFNTIQVDLTGSIVNDDEKTEGTQLSFGVAVAADGTQTRVDATDGSASIVLSGVWHDGQHGWTNAKAKVKVNGPVKIGFGNCTYGNHAVKVNDADGNTLLSGETEAVCWDKKSPTDKVTYLIYKGEATTLELVGAGYTPYFSVEAVDPSTLGSDATITFDISNASAEGTAPASIKAEVGSDVTIPLNRTLYLEGSTLTAWSDGTNSYKVGEVMKMPEGGATLTPVFTANSANLGDRTETVQLSWKLGEGNGAPTITKQGASNASAIIVTQATVNGNTIDVKLGIDAANGKFSNAGRGDKWAQVNSGTVFTVPSCKGATIALDAYSAISTTTIDGQSDYASGTSVSYTIAGTSETVDIVIGDGSYYSDIAVTLPVVAQSGGKTFENVEGTVTWTVGNEANGTVSAALEGAFSNTSVSTGSEMTISEATYFDTKMVKYRPNTKNPGAVAGVMIEYRVKPSAGLTFKPTKVTYDAVKVGTDGATYSWSYVAGNEESSITKVDAATTLRNNGSNSATAKIDHELEITADATDAFAIRFYISDTANDKDICIGNVVIHGIVNGTMQDVTKYTLTAAPSPAEAGTATIYPNGSEFDEGTEITLTATENFGYKFVNWTDGNGQEVSKDAKFTYTLASNSELTANFKQVNTYELALTVEGGANDYMVKLNPAPTIVEGKNMYEEGTQVTLTAINNTILTFTNWSNGSTASENKVVMNENMNITATYTAIDYIVGWDFYNAGNNGRPADFVSASENTSATLILRNTEGSTQSWLDKSTVAAGGYENFAGAAVNWKGLGEYYYQTKVNALNYTNIKVKSQMLYNYNVYTTQVLEYSLDNENWKEVTSVNMTSGKTIFDVDGQLPEEANHAEQLYIRWRPDLNSTVNGSEGNDGTAISNIYILADADIYNDGKAPALLSTLPVNNGTGASATGRIVLNFDEKIKLTDNAKATLNNEDIALNISGKTLTAEYKNLEYATAYEFKLAGSSVADLADNVLTDEIAISFTTMERPTVTKGTYDREVTTVQELKDALQAANGSSRFRIFVHNGTYDLGNACLTNVKGNISLIGESMDNTIIMNTPEEEGIGVTATLFISGSNVYMQDITLKNAYPYGNTTGRAVCLQDKGDKTISKRVKLLSYQDTYYSNNSNGRFYWEDSELHGVVDFLCGGGDVFYNRCNIVVETRGGDVIAAPNGQRKYGYVFLDCEINGEDAENGKYYLGRPWGAGCRAQYINTRMNILPYATGWTEMSGHAPAVFAEYNSTDKSGNSIDLTSRKLTFEGGTQESAVLTEEQVAELSIANVMGSSDGWNPQLSTEQAPTPANVSLSGNTLTWSSSDYVLCWAVCKNGSVVAFTTTPEYTVDDATASYAVRAANEMGGLGEAAEPTTETSIREVAETEDVVSTHYFNTAGIEVGSHAKGVVLKVMKLKNGKTITQKVVK